MVMLTATVVYSVCHAFYEELPWKYRAKECVYDTMKLSQGVTYFHLYDNPGYVKNADGKKTVTDIDWLFKPLGRDTLACHKSGDKRGYLSLLTGEVAITPPIYSSIKAIAYDLYLCEDSECRGVIINGKGQKVR